MFIAFIARLQDYSTQDALQLIDYCNNRYRLTRQKVDYCASIEHPT